jgi:hypothetical protein
MSQDGRLVIGVRRRDVPTILELNRHTAKWDTMHLSPVPGGVLGFDGNVLVGGNFSTLERFRAPASPGAN